MTFVKGFPLILLVASMCSHGAVQPDRTRIIFNSKDKATSLRVENRSDKLPYLAYSWIENEKGEKMKRERKAMNFSSPCRLSSDWSQKRLRRFGS